MGVNRLPKTLTPMKRTITYIKCCADSFRLFRCNFIAFVLFPFAALIHLFSAII